MELKKSSNGIDRISTDQELRNESIEKVRSNLLDTLKSLVHKCKAEIKADLQALFACDDDQNQFVKSTEVKRHTLPSNIEAWLENYMRDPKNR